MMYILNVNGATTNNAIQKKNLRKHMSKNMDDLEFKQTVLDTKSASFCGAKWYNATIWLGSGMTTSCHHP